MRGWLGVVIVGVGCQGDSRQLPDAAFFVDAPFPPDAPSCGATTGAGTMHTGTIAAAEEWTAAGSPHLIPFDLTVSAVVTIDACAVVEIAGTRTITVHPGGAINATGSAQLPVTISGSDATPWASIRALGGTLSFTSTTISGGGNRLSAGPLLAGAIEVTGTPGAAQPILHVDHVTISDSDTQGVYVHDGGGFDASSTALSIAGAKGYPIHTFARSAGTVPSGTYTGNAIDEILITGSGGPEAMLEDATLHAVGVPYHIGTGTSAAYLDVGGVGHPAKLTIEPGVVLRFAPGGRMRIDPASSTIAATGALVAIGTQNAPIRFTSAAAAPAAGDWDGIWFGGLADPATRLQYAVVEYAGRANLTGSESCIPTGQIGQNDAAIRIFGAAPASVFITDTTIIASGRYGIDRGFRADIKPDFATGNTFTNVPACQQTYPRDLNGACPTTIPCP